MFKLFYKLEYRFIRDKVSSKLTLVSYRSNTTFEFLTLSTGANTSSLNTKRNYTVLFDAFFKKVFIEDLKFKSFLFQRY